MHESVYRHSCLLTCRYRIYRELRPCVYIASDEYICLCSLVSHRICLDRAVGVELHVSTAEKSARHYALTYREQHIVTLGQQYVSLIVYRCEAAFIVK